MHCANRFRNRTYQCTAENYAVSLRATQGRKQKFAKIRYTKSHGTAFAPKQCLYQKQATVMENFKMYCPTRYRNRTYQCGAANYPVSWGQYRVENSNLCKFGSTYRHGTAFPQNVYIKSYGYGQLLLQSVEKPHLPVWVYKLPRFMAGSIGPRIKIYVNSGLPTGMVPRFHKRNVYIKRKLRVWTAQKCIAIVR